MRAASNLDIMICRLCRNSRSLNFLMSYESVQAKWDSFTFMFFKVTERTRKKSKLTAAFLYLYVSEEAETYLL